MSDRRQIFKSAQRCRTEVRELIQGIFVGELISPSSTLWIVSPWISDVVVIDNRTGGFDGLNPEWGAREIRLREVLLELLRKGAEVVLATRPDSHNDGVLAPLQASAADLELQHLLGIHQHHDLHEKGLCGDLFHLSGSMNLTYNGIEVLEESISYETDLGEVSRVRISYSSRWPLDGGQRA